jgi:hypothetical protein
MTLVTLTFQPCANGLDALYGRDDERGLAAIFVRGFPICHADILAGHPHKVNHPRRACTRRLTSFEP